MTYIQLQTEIPGPKSREILARRAAAVTNGLAKATDIVVESASGAVVRDVDGNTLLDFAGGIGMLAVGHSPKNVVDAMHTQAEKLIHMCSIVATYEPYVELAELLNRVAPGDFPKKTLLSNSGSEAVEYAINLARAYTKRPAVMAFEGAYHGRTQLALSLTSKYGLFKKQFGPFAPEIYRIPAPNVYRHPPGMTEEEFVEWSCWSLENALIAQVDPSAIAAMIIEPVQGEAGFIPMPPAFLAKIREICTQHGIVMIADEVQCGMGRTGKLFAMEHYGMAADMTTTAKSLGAGMPIAATIGRAEIMDAAHPGGVGGTYGGSPVAIAAALEAVNMINTPEFLNRAAQIGKTIRETMLGWKEKYPMIGDVRGLGAMMLVEFVKDRETKEPIPNETLAIIRYAAQHGLILIRAGLYSNCIRLLPPLNMPDDMLHEGLAVLEAGIASAQKTL